MDSNQPPTKCGKVPMAVDIEQTKKELVGEQAVCDKCSHEFEVHENVRTTSSKGTTKFVTDCPNCGESTELLSSS